MNRVIIFGRAEYKNLRSIKLARAEYIRHNETKAKGDLLFKPEVLFGEDPEEELTELHLEFKRKIHEANDKTLTNTLNALELLLQFAIAGRIDLFIIEAGELPRQQVLEVRNDKSTVHAFVAGLEAMEEERWADAIGPLTDAIDSFARHPWAYNARGDSHFQLDQIEEAASDYETATKLYPDLPNPHLGLAKIAHKRGQRAATIDNCERAMNGSIPHQPGYWICALFQTQVFLDLVEQEAYNGEAERESFLRNANKQISRYESKLRQLGSSRSPLYPSPERLEELSSRYETIAGIEAAT